MNTEDFNFLLRKEFLILCLLLLALTFAQISLGQLSGISGIEPFLVMNISLFDTLGMILPVFTIFFLYLNNRSSQGHSWYLIFYMIGGIILITSAIAMFGVFIQQPEEETSILPDANITSSITTTTTTQSIEPIQPPSPPVGSNPTDLSSLSQFLTEIRGFFFIVVLLLPLLILIAIQRQSRLKEEESVDTDEIPADNKEKHHRTRTILECYHQASTHLEEHGADSSSCFTPTEFSADVVEKELTPLPLINNLTDVFEEAKFSNHDISIQKVDLAKSFSSKIIFSSDSSSKTGIDKELEEIE